MPCIDTFETYERQKGRNENRHYSLFALTQEAKDWTLKNKWYGIERIVKVHRFGTRDNKPVEETALFMLSKPLDNAQKVGEGVRGHWAIENDLHYSKDVFLKEDDLPVHDPYKATVIAILNTVALNLLKINKLKPCLDNFALFSNKVNELFSILNLNFVSFRT